MVVAALVFFLDIPQKNQYAFSCPFSFCIASYRIQP
jgi:hypothetical protein